MIVRNVIQLFFKVLLYLAVYLLVTSRISLFSFASCFSYTAAILLLPIRYNAVRILVFSFVTGLLVDVFSSTPGIHSAACVVLGFFRASFLNWMVPAGGYEDYMNITIPSMGLKWFLPFTLGLLFLHSLVYFTIDYASFSHFGMVLLRAAATTLFTWGAIVVMQFGIEPPRRND